jgi:hypothetical protein
LRGEPLSLSLSRFSLLTLDEVLPLLRAFSLLSLRSERSFSSRSGFGESSGCGDGCVGLAFGSGFFSMSWPSAVKEKPKSNSSAKDSGKPNHEITKQIQKKKKKRKKKEKKEKRKRRKKKKKNRNHRPKRKLESK